MADSNNEGSPYKLIKLLMFIKLSAFFLQILKI